MTLKYRFLELLFRTLLAYLRDRPLGRVAGLENLPPRGQGYIAAANHRSFVDGMLLPHTLVWARKEPVHMVSYRELFDLPFFGSVLRGAEGLVLDRRSREGIERFFRDARYVLLERHECVGMHPEAHLQKPGPTLGRGRPGTARLAVETGCPVVPVGLFGTEVVMPRGTTKLRYKRRALSIEIGKPVYLDRYSKSYDKADARTKKLILGGCTTIIMRAIGEITGQRYPFGERALARLAEYAERPAGP